MRPKKALGILLLVPWLLAPSCSSEFDQTLIVPQAGYSWPSTDRNYWPTDGWETADMEDHDMNSSMMTLAHEFAQNDPLTRALLVVKNGYLVYEQYYDEGGIDQSTDLWSVTKSYTSALVGIIMDDNTVSDTEQLMADLMPDYPEFQNITLQQVLTQTTGLAWTEGGPLWVEWIFSDDWVESALARGQVSEPGTRFFYSSANSHFLTALVKHQTGMAPGHLAKERLFDPMGVAFDTLSETIVYQNWSEYQEPMYQTWRKDPQGIESASFGLYQRARDMAKFGFLYLNRGKWDHQQLISEDWVKTSTRDHETDIYGRYSYGYQWYITLVDGVPAFLASGFGGQVIGVVPSMDLVVVLKYEAEDPVHPESGTAHDDMKLFELVVQAVDR